MNADNRDNLNLSFHAYRKLSIGILLSLVAACAGHSNLIQTESSDAAVSTRAFAPSQTPIESDFWDHRLSYPGGEFQASWMREEREKFLSQNKSLPQNSSDKSKSTKAVNGWLDPNRATSLGPQPLDWSGAGFPFGEVGGRVNVVLTHPSDPRIAWFGSDGGGVWKTTNCCGAETTWSAKTDSAELFNISIGALALDPNNPDVIYAGTGDFRRNRPFTFGAGGLLKSIDGGESWRVLGQTIFNPVYTQAVGLFPQIRALSAIVVDRADSNRIAVGTNQGLYLSYDGGNAWIGPCFTNTFATQRQDITGLLRRVGSNGSSELIAAIGALGRTSTVRSDLNQSGANGIYRATWPSTPACPSDWSLISRPNNGWPPNSGNGIPRTQANANPLKRIDLAIAPSDERVMYAQVEELGVWRTSDAGATWVQRAIQPNDFSTGCRGDSFQSGMLFQSYNAGLIVDPQNPNTVFLSATDVWRSTNGADSFTNLTCGYDVLQSGRDSGVHVDNHARAFVGGDAQKLLVGNDGGINYSDNALSAEPRFENRNGNSNTIELYSGDLSAGFDNLSNTSRAIGGGSQDNGGATRTWNNNEIPAAGKWIARQGGDGISVQIEPILGNRWYYSTQFGNIFASQSGPNTLANFEITPEHNWSDDRRGFLMPFYLHKFGDEVTCPSARGCQHMLVGTMRVWETLNGGFPNFLWYANSPDLTKALSNSNDLSIINKLEYAPSDASRAIVGTNDGNVWMGLGLGQGITNSATWRNVTNANSVLPNRPIMDVQIHPNNFNVAYVGLAGFDQNTPTTPGHLYRLICSADCVNFTWENVSGNLPNVPVNAVQVDPTNSQRVFAGTDWGLYFTDNIETNNPVWQRFAGGLPSVMIWDLVVDRGATTLGIFTRSRGAWVWPLRASNSQTNLTGIWYEPNQGGWGVSIAHQRETLFPVWYSYDASGRPLWLSSAATRQADGSYFDSVYRFNGTPFNLINNAPANLPANIVGNARFTPIENNALRFDYTVNGISQSKILQKFSIGTAPICRFTSAPRTEANNHTDIWWNQNESGWGLYLSESNNSIFMAWYTYASDGNAQWITGLLSRGNDGRYTGALNRPNSGTPFNNINGPATSFPLPEVGSASLTFSNGETAVFNYTLDGISQQKNMTRFVFAGPEVSVCE